MTPQDRALYAFAFRIFGDFGVTIAVPAVLAALLGKWLDGQQLTAPRYLIFSLVIAFLLTIFLIKRKAKRYGDEYQKLIK